MRKLLVLIPVAVMPGCATLVEGTSDTVTLSTNPPGATCTVDRNGERVGAVSTTPGSIRIGKSRHDLQVACTKDGYQPASATASSSFTGTTLGNILAGGLIGVAVDAASGANSRYPSDVRVDMVEVPRPVEPTPPMAAAPAEPQAVRPVRHQRLRGPGV